MQIMEVALRPFGNFRVGDAWRVGKNRGGGVLMYQVGWLNPIPQNSLSHDFFGEVCFLVAGGSSSHLVSHRCGG